MRKRPPFKPNRFPDQGSKLPCSLVGLTLECISFLLCCLRHEIHLTLSSWGLRCSGRSFRACVCEQAPRATARFLVRRADRVCFTHYRTDYRMGRTASLPAFLFAGNAFIPVL